MPSIATFSAFKDPDAISVSRPRRVYHSAKHKMLSSKGSAAGEVIDKVAVSGATVNAACTIAVAAGATGAFAVAASGPIAAGALGVVGIILAAKASYSNRDAAHKKLMPHVWSYIDDEAPEPITEGNKKDVAAAALSLISDGQPQMRLKDSKLNEREKAFVSFWTKYQKVSISHASYNHGMKGELVMIAVYRNEPERQKLLDKALASGGAIYEYMRRLGHLANYMQAPMVFGKVMQGDASPLQDFAKTVTRVQETRNELKQMSERIASDDRAFEAVQRVIETG